MIFDGRERTRQGGWRAGEPNFAYLDESARPEAARVRALLNSMIANYPASERQTLIDRIRNEDLHGDATFELLVHQWCLNVGMTVLAVEPSIPGTSKTPDFLVEAAGQRFYLECAVARGESDKAAASNSRRDDVLREIDAVNSPDFMLGVDVEGVPSQPVRLRALSDRISRWLSDLDHSQIAASAVDEVPLFEENLHGMSLSLRPIPRQNSRGDGTGRATGIFSSEIRVVQPWVKMREPLLRKAKRYGTPDLPLVVALNAADQDAELEHAIDALYGTEVWLQTSGGLGHQSRLPDGVWFGPKGPQCTRLSGVLVACDLGPWTLGQKDAMFIENISASRPAGFVDFRVPAWRVADGGLRRHDGVSLQSVFNLSADWPEQVGAPTDS